MLLTQLVVLNLKALRLSICPSLRVAHQGKVCYLRLLCLFMCPVAVARCSSDGAVVCYIRMSSYVDELVDSDVMFFTHWRATRVFQSCQNLTGETTAVDSNLILANKGGEVWFLRLRHCSVRNAIDLCGVCWWSGVDSGDSINRHLSSSRGGRSVESSS